MKIILIISICLSVFIFPIGAYGENELKTELVTIDASFSFNEPLGEIWNVKIKEFINQIGAEVNFIKVVSSGARFSGSAMLNRESIERIKTTISDQDFFKLPRMISEEFIPLHMPNYLLEVCKGSYCHRVRLYDQESIGKSEEMDRFIVIWNVIMSHLPEWPTSWPNVSTNNEN